MDGNKIMYRFWTSVGLLLRPVCRLQTVITLYLITAVLVLLQTAGQAEATDVVCELAVDARFTESAPRDFFSIRNQSAGQWSIISIRLDLAASAGQLIFDTEDGGKGVDVFQLFDVAEGTALMSKADVPNDGDSVLQVQFERFGSGQSFSFSIDVDDQLIDSTLGQTRVAGSEIAGSVLQAILINEQGERRTQLLRFTKDNVTVVEKPGC